MTAPPAPSTRRDVRHALAPGRGTVRYADPIAPGWREARLSLLSVSGLAFVLDSAAVAPPDGSRLEGVVVEVGHCVLEGEAVVRNLQPLSGNRVEIGCLFYPGSIADEERLVVLLAGMTAAQPLPETSS